MSKPENQTWEEYIQGKESESLLEEFWEEMASQLREALAESELDESRYEVEAGDRPEVGTTDDWMLDEKDDAVELRDVLREAGIGDESVGVYLTPWGSDGVAELPPDHVPVDEYEVFIELRQVHKAQEEAASNALDKME